jgi:hypothetical protein
LWRGGIQADTGRNVMSRLRFSPRRTLVLHLLLVVSLLIAQSAAFAHVSTHLNLKGSPDASGIAGKAPQLCGECLEGAALLGAAGAPYVPSIVQVAAVAVRVATLVCTPVEQRSHHPFRSRAPPRPL